MPRLRVGPDYRMDEDSNFSSGLRSRSRSPHPLVGFTSKEEQERQDHELALRLQEEEVNRAHSPVVEATLRPEEIEAILGSPYVPLEQNVQNLEDSDMETISIRSSSPPDSPPPPPPSPPPLSEGEAEMYDGELTLPPDWSEHREPGDAALGPLWNEHDAGVDSDSGDDINASDDDDSDDDSDSEESTNANESGENHDADTDESANESEGGGGHIEEQSDDSGEEMDDSEDDDIAPAEAPSNDGDSDSSSSDSSDSDNDNNDLRSETPEQFLIRAYADLNSIELALTDLETVIENNRRELLAEESHQDSEEEEEPDDTVIRSGDYGRCTICFEEMPYDPVGCIYCQQLIGCRRCVNRWYAAANRRGDSIDFFGEMTEDKVRKAHMVIIDMMLLSGCK
ncbi:unnamed protein product [Cylicocyclus nassatus]|uniref:RING-type domain-containing protein n=1 Tax=Cylicocyclus nassatus TaxID=53992 RepID=A0AA36GJ36_CYLNA|nr:unnamed protein product [Cylicocyclus nassatus]